MEPLLPPPTLQYLFSVQCAVDPPLEIGNGPYGRRRCVPITGGTVRGKHLNGEVLPVGADFMYVPETSNCLHERFLIAIPGLWKKTKLYMSIPTMLLKVMTGRTSMSGMLLLHTGIQYFFWAHIPSGIEPRDPVLGRRKYSKH